jgi:hypothetical protein
MCDGENVPNNSRDALADSNLASKWKRGGVKSPPGTVSKKIRRFTSGSNWNNIQNRQENDPKPAIRAYEASLSNLTSKGTAPRAMPRSGQGLVAQAPPLQPEETTDGGASEYYREKCALRRSAVLRTCLLPTSPTKRNGWWQPDCSFGPLWATNPFLHASYTLHDTNALRFVYQGVTQLKSTTLESLLKQGGASNRKFRT